VGILDASAVLVGKTLARAHARSVDPGLVAGYLGSGEEFASAITAFSIRYADQVEQDYQRFLETPRPHSEALLVDL